MNMWARFDVMRFFFFSLFMSQGACRCSSSLIRIRRCRNFMRVARNNDRRSTNTVAHVYDFAKLTCTRKTTTCYSSLSVSRSLLLDFVHRDSGGDFLPYRMYTLKPHFSYDRRSARAVFHLNKIEVALKKDTRMYLPFTMAVVIRIRSLTMAKQFVLNKDVRNCTSE